MSQFWFPRLKINWAVLHRGGSQYCMLCNTLLSLKSPSRLIDRAHGRDTSGRGLFEESLVLITRTLLCEALLLCSRTCKLYTCAMSFFWRLCGFYIHFRALVVRSHFPAGESKVRLIQELFNPIAPVLAPIAPVSVWTEAKLEDFLINISQSSSLHLYKCTLPKTQLMS